MNVKSMFASWKTAAIGALAVICGGSHLAGLIPDQYVAVVDGVCTVLVGLGLIAAKDGDVSHSTVSGEAKPVS